MSHIQIRVTHDDWSFIYSVLDDYWRLCSKALVFYHTSAERNHYHIYLFDLSTQAQSVRKKFKNYFKGNEDFSISTTCGRAKKPISINGAYIYGTTIDLIPPFKSKEFTQQELFQLEILANEFYSKLKSKEQTTTEITLLKTHEVLIRSDHTWERLLELITLEQEKFENYSINDFKKFIIADYLNRAKPIPRMADLNRYAYSLFYVKGKKQIEPNEVNLPNF